MHAPPRAPFILSGLLFSLGGCGSGPRHFDYSDDHGVVCQDCNSSFRQTSCQITEFDGKTEIFNILNPLDYLSTKSDNMGFKPLVTTVQSTTKFKRKVASTSTPPATPFNNTSFLIRLQQLREHYNPKRLQFDQYGSMEHVINSFFATPQNPAHSSMANKTCSPKSPNHPNSRRNHASQELSCSCGAGASSSAMGDKIGKDPGMREPDGVRHHQHCMDDNFDINLFSQKEQRVSSSDLNISFMDGDGFFTL